MPNINQSLSKQQRERIGRFDQELQPTQESRRARRALRIAMVRQRAQQRLQTGMQQAQAMAATAIDVAAEHESRLQGRAVVREASGPRSLAAKMLFAMVLLNMIRPVGGADTAPSSDPVTTTDDDGNQDHSATSGSAAQPDPASAAPVRTAALHADSVVAASRFFVNQQAHGLSATQQVQAIIRFRNRACLQQVLATVYEEEP